MHRLLYFPYYDCCQLMASYKIVCHILTDLLSCRVNVTPSHLTKLRPCCHVTTHTYYILKQTAKKDLFQHKKKVLLKPDYKKNKKEENYTLILVVLNVFK